jgi:hypothetical protein
MERQEIIGQIQEIIEKYGYIHCYENIIGNCMPPKPAHLILNKISKVVDGVFYDDGSKKGFMQGFHKNYVTIVRYRNAEPVDCFSLDYQMLPVKYLTECLNFLRRK